MIALAAILSFIKVFALPQGGSVTAGSMVPIILFALVWGGRDGMLAGLVYGLLQFLLDGIAIHVLSILIDYLLAFSLLGVAGFFGKNRTQALLGTILAVFLRFLASFFSGWLIFGSYAPAGQSPALYSFIYNASYLLPELIITTVLVALLYLPYTRLVHKRP